MLKEIRMVRLFRTNSGRMVLIIMDYGIRVKPMQEIENSTITTRIIAEGGADVILVSPGIPDVHTRELIGKTSLMICIDRRSTSIGLDVTNDRLICSVESVASIGADAVTTFGVIGVPCEGQLCQKNCPCS